MPRFSIASDSDSAEVEMQQYPHSPAGTDTTAGEEGLVLSGKIEELSIFVHVPRRLMHPLVRP